MGLCFRAEGLVLREWSRKNDSLVVWLLQAACRRALDSAGTFIRLRASVPGGKIIQNKDTFAGQKRM